MPRSTSAARASVKREPGLLDATPLDRSNPAQWDSKPDMSPILVETFPSVSARAHRRSSWPRLRSAPRIRVYPHRILRDEPDYELLHTGSTGWSTGPTARQTVVLLGDELTVPAQEGFRGHDAGELLQTPPTHVRSQVRNLL
jgi:hypothetical protein